MERQLLHTVKIGPKLWMLTEDFYYVPKGFITDMASVPKLFQNVLAPATGPHAEAAVLHDFFYSLDCKLGFTQKESDELFLELMRENGTWFHRSYLAYYGVRCGGKMSFRKKYCFEKLDKAYGDVRDKLKNEFKILRPTGFEGFCFT